jgi:hypothetical protein
MEHRIDPEFSKSRFSQTWNEVNERGTEVRWCSDDNLGPEGTVKLCQVLPAMQALASLDLRSMLSNVNNRFITC